jgi:hypothetical protein
MKKLLYLIAVMAFAGCNSVNKNNKMTPFRYIVALTTSHGNDETKKQGRNEDLWLEVLNITRGFPLYGLQKQSGSTELHIVPASKKSRQEITEELKAIRDVRSVSVVEVSNPIKEAELAEIRNLLAGIELDASNISNDLLALFLEDKLQGEYTYFMEMHRTRIDEVPVPISIIRTEDLPGVTPEILADARKERMYFPNRRLTKDDFETFTEDFVLEVTEEDPSNDLEPPPPAPAKLNTMSDEELKQWVQKEYRPKPRYKDIQIKRTTKEIEIIMKFGDVTESFSYLLKNR